MYEVAEYFQATQPGVAVTVVVTTMVFPVPLSDFCSLLGASETIPIVGVG
jgi:hypothetical protein